MWTQFSVVNMIVVTITTTFNWEQLKSFSARRVCMCEFFLPLPAFWNLGIPFLNCYNQVQSKQIPLWLAEGFNYLFSFRSFAFYSHHFWTNILHITRTRTQPQPHTCTNIYHLHTYPTYTLINTIYRIYSLLILLLSELIPCLNKTHTHCTFSTIKTENNVILFHFTLIWRMLETCNQFW